MCLVGLVILVVRLSVVVGFDFRNDCWLVRVVRFVLNLVLFLFFCIYVVVFLG